MGEGEGGRERERTTFCVLIQFVGQFAIEVLIFVYDKV